MERRRCRTSSFIENPFSLAGVGDRGGGGDLGCVANLAEVDFAQIEFLERLDHAGQRCFASRKIFSRAGERIASRNDEIF